MIPVKLSNDNCQQFMFDGLTAEISILLFCYGKRHWNSNM